MHKLNPLAFAALFLVLLSACTKGGDGGAPTIPRVKKPKLLINGPTDIAVQLYRDTVLIPFQFTSDSSKEIEVKGFVFTGADNDVSMSVTSLTGTTPFTDTLKVYTNPGAGKTIYIRQMAISYDSDAITKTLQIHVVPNTNCSFLFTGQYTFHQLYPPSPTPFASFIAETGTNAGTITNFANTGKTVTLSFDCTNELLNIPLQAFDSSTTIHGSGSWSGSNLNINYTLVTSAFTSSGSIQGTR